MAIVFAAGFLIGALITGFAGYFFIFRDLTGTVAEVENARTRAQAEQRAVEESFERLEQHNIRLAGALERERGKRKALETEIQRFERILSESTATLGELTTGIEGAQEEARVSEKLIGELLGTIRAVGEKGAPP